MLNTRFLTLALLFLNALFASGQGSFFNHLEAIRPEKITLFCEWDSLVAIKDDTEMEARMVITGENINEEWKTDLALRGRFRRSKCPFPPLEINLKKGALRDRGFGEFDKFKLVTHCNNESPDPIDLYEELLAYQLYGILTPCYFRALPLRVDYLYPNGKAYKKDAVALILEPTAELAHRMQGKELEQFGAAADSLDAAAYCRNAMFQFMIGNFDWDHVMQRNIKMIGDVGHYHLVPYDFDFSAIVSPPYARMPSEHGLKDFRDRIYLGQFFQDYIPTTIQEFVEKKSAFMAHIDSYPYLTKSRKREISAYLEKFYEFITNSETVIQKGTILRWDQ